MYKPTFFFAALLVLIPLAVNEVNAQQQITGPDYDIKIIQAGEGIFSSHPQRVLENGEWKDYTLFEDANIIQVETGQGSFEINKNTCSFAFYNGGTITGNPIIPSEVYLARQSTDAIVWSEVNQINNAACTTIVIADGENIEVQTIKTHAMGEMKIRYIKNVGERLKSQMEVTNTSGLNDRFFGFFHIMQVPQFINWNGNQIDLANKNGTFYDRTFIIANKDKILNLADKIHYDFDKSFSSLLGITVLYDGTNTFLEFDYSFNAAILPDGETFVIDPEYSDSGDAVWRRVYESVSDVEAVCDDTVNAKDTTATQMRTPTAAASDLCVRFIPEWDISPLTTNVTVTSTTLEFGTLNFNLGVDDCRWVAMQFQPSVAPAADLFIDAANGTQFRSDNGCRTGNQNYTLGALANADINIAIDASRSWWSVGGSIAPSNVRDAVFEEVRWGTTEPTLHLEFVYGQTPDAVTDLIAANITAAQVDLAWTEPDLQNGTLSGYEIKFTTPHGSPQTVIENDTGTNVTNFMVGGLATNTQYSFRVGPWTNVTNNFTGNIVNITTLPLGNFTVGFFSLNATQSDARDFRYTRVDINATALNLEVVYPDNFNASCNFFYKFSRVNQTFFNLATTPEPDSMQKATFQFIDVNREVIDVLCRAEPSGVTSPYLLTITDFPLLQQFRNFTSGVYGTSGQFGTIDLIALGVIIVMMVGFNRVNESVGGIFAVIVLGFATYFEIVQWYSFMFGSFAIIIMLIIASTRKM